MILESNHPELEAMLKSLSPRERNEIRNRRNGKSTAIAFETLAECMRNPGKWVKISDHHATPLADRNLARTIMWMLERLDFKCFELRKPDCYLRFNPDFKWREVDYSKK